MQATSGRPCSTPGCGGTVQLYRQCADNICKKEIGYCKGCGGDNHALVMMQAHMQEHKKVTP